MFMSPVAARLRVSDRRAGSSVAARNAAIASATASGARLGQRPAAGPVAAAWGQLDGP